MKIILDQLFVLCMTIKMDQEGVINITRIGKWAIWAGQDGLEQ